jgi:hypothetical protein
MKSVGATARLVRLFARRRRAGDVTRPVYPEAVYLGFAGVRHGRLSGALTMVGLEPNEIASPSAARLVTTGLAA